MRRRIVALLAMVVMAVAMLAAAAPVFAQERGPGACDPNPGESEGSQSHVITPPGGVVGVVVRDPTANEHHLPDSGLGDFVTGHGRNVIECST